MRDQQQVQDESIRTVCVEPLEARTLMAADVVLEWNRIAIETTKTPPGPQITPPRQLRMLAMVHGAVFDAVNSVERDYKPYLVKDKAPRWASPEAAAAVAARDVLVGLFPTKLAEFDAALATSLAAVPDGPAEDAGIAAGQAAASAMLAARQDDGIDAPATYTAGTGPEAWQPTSPGGTPLLPGFANMEPFVIHSPRHYRAGPPPSITSDAFELAFEEVKAIGSAASATRSMEQTEIARYWAGPPGTVQPPGHWNRIARTVATDQDNSLAENARMFALLNFGMCDALIAAWDTKYEYNYVRPVTAIRNADGDGNPDTAADPGWTPLLGTPGHPSYSSAHSSISSAAATVLGTFFGDDSIAFSDTAEFTPGGMQATRSFDGFWEAAEEAGASRVYGGIHWQFDNQAGLGAGRDVGEFVSHHVLHPLGAGHQDGPAVRSSGHGAGNSNESFTHQDDRHDSQDGEDDDASPRSVIQ